ncbi:hypothetical protein BpHYR1_034296 [Brachionus plicatilis]|uniref:Uncharacterized protein n=1 Tax=Brachionus plicatilis TaxID=10195 RepID=A0A3M7RVI9_BRAPC|nr:hypothetical protein BpHYR1_034296 [Brachionus plicatilis]
MAAFSISSVSFVRFKSIDFGLDSVLFMLSMDLFKSCFLVISGLKKSFDLYGEVFSIEYNTNLMHFEKIFSILAITLKNLHQNSLNFECKCGSLSNNEKHYNLNLKKTLNK